ncbi:hypothetical protein Nmel_006513, partial [Mimus melanotis]
MSENSSATEKAAFYALLAKYNTRPSQGGEEWMNNNWFNLENVFDRICSLQHESKFKLGKNKTILISVLGTGHVAAIETRSKRGSEENIIIDSLQNLVQILQKQLDQERNENHLLQAALREERTKNSKQVETPTETEEKEISEVAEELLSYSRKYGPIKVPEEKLEKTKGVRHIVSPSDKPEKGKQTVIRQYWWSLGVKKQTPKDVMDVLPLDKLIKIVLNWHCPKSIAPDSPIVQPSAPPPSTGSIVGPKRAPVTFVVDTGAQISALIRKAAQKCGIVPTKRQCFVVNALGTTEAMDTAVIKILLPGEENLLLIKTTIGDILNDLLGINVLAGRQWEDEEGHLWSFGTP